MRKVPPRTPTWRMRVPFCAKSSSVVLYYPVPHQLWSRKYLFLAPNHKHPTNFGPRNTSFWHQTTASHQLWPRKWFILAPNRPSSHRNRRTRSSSTGYLTSPLCSLKVIVSPGFTSPEMIFSANGSSMWRCIARLSGRAPYWGS